MTKACIDEYDSWICLRGRSSMWVDLYSKGKINKALKLEDKDKVKITLEKVK